jgi:dTDP-4-dehydrorhamnose 3,5-epimerase
MQALDTTLPDVLLLETAVHGDERGFFTEAFRAEWLAQRGVVVDWVQDNHSRSTRGVLRGLHYQPGMPKLVRVARGSILDVLVDLRRDSPAFGQWEAFELTESNGRLLYVPDGFGHGFIVTSDIADVTYKCGAYWDPQTEGAVAPDDPDIGIEWPDVGIEPVVSDRDRSAPRLADARDSLPF